MIIQSEYLMLTRQVFAYVVVQNGLWHEKDVARKGAKSPQFTVGGSGKENITVQVCISATGVLLPPYILYSGVHVRLMQHQTQDGPAGTRFAVSQKGWMTETNFLDWFRNQFIPHLPEEHPVLLILDCHESHVKYDVRQLAVQHGIEIAKLPAHTTHILQPLDVAVIKLTMMKLLTNCSYKKEGT